MRLNHLQKVAAEHDLSSGGVALPAAILEGEHIDKPAICRHRKFLHAMNSISAIAPKRASSAITCHVRHCAFPLWVLSKYADCEAGLRQ